MEDEEDVVVSVEIHIRRDGPYDYVVEIEAATSEGDYSTTSLGATSIKDATERAAIWLGE